MRFRAGGKLEGRTIYVQLGDTPDRRPPSEGGDPVIGMVDPGWAQFFVGAANAWTERNSALDVLSILGPEAEAQIHQAARARAAADLQEGSPQ